MTEISNNFSKTVLLDRSNVFQYIGPKSQRFETLCWLAHDLRKKGWHLRRGVNYGAEFLLYNSSPDDVHSKYYKL